GEDRITFVHGMVTQDVKGIPEPGAAYTALLTVKGAMVADARIVRRPQELLIDAEPGFGEKVFEFLSRYLISEDAELDDASEDWGYLEVAGPRATEVVGAAVNQPAVPAAAEHGVVQAEFQGDLLWLVGSRRYGVPGVDLLVPRQQLAPLFERLTAAGKSLGLRCAGWEATETARVEAGIPRFGQDMEETTIPLEAELTRALHYNKGCYIGQEVIARATYRGHMNRKLTGLVFDGPAPSFKTELRRGEKKVGWVTSALHSPALGKVIGLGYVHRDSLESGTELEVTSGGRATVHALPFVS
ncbi:MAG TPA: glycine cleavage T C-terminal barrel domain-containing protein, partial [Myxococcaceae bacterium]|nr:glycine cleavage T C-terminal barrel domain-containing protein [Myxococcaceae bacterium]